MGTGRNWLNCWKPLIDSLVPLLGRAPGHTEFDIEDGRIVSLALHREIDPALNHAVQAQLWWRMPTGRARAVAALNYELRQVQAEHGGYIVITDTAGPPRLHRAGCPDVRETYFVQKVVANGMRNGKYLQVASPEDAYSRPRLQPHGCV